MIVRLVVLALVVGGAFAIVWLAQRSRGRSRVGLPPGLVLVTSPGCTVCGPAEMAVRAAGESFSVLDVSEIPELGVRSVPTLFRVGERGVVVARRSGRAAVVAPVETGGWTS
jgi:hypothetical protein